MKRRKKYQFTLMFAITLVVLGCGVKEREPTQGQSSPVVVGNLPEGVWTTKEKKLLVRPSSPTFEVGETAVTYKFVTSEMDLPSSPDYTFEIHYWMPTMPEMPVTPAKIEVASPGHVKVTYDISMGGLWEVTLKVHRNGNEVDTLTYSYNVPE